MRTDQFDFDLPSELIAQRPVEGARDQSRLMVLDRGAETIQHRRFFELSDFLQAGDLLVFNDSKVFPGRLFVQKAPSGGKMELLLLRREGEGSAERWEALVGGKRVRPGQPFEAAGLAGRLLEKASDTTWWCQLNLVGSAIHDYLRDHGHTPIPPYITDTELEEDELRERYQTVYAREEGSAAAPTAGFHFSTQLLTELHELGVETASVTLHVGLGTFAPVKVDDIAQHAMHSEFATVTHETAAAVNEARSGGRRVIAVGTTSVRTLESFASNGLVHAGQQWTNIFITPGYRFQIIDALITNFHLPRSTLLMLVSAFAGTNFTAHAYQEAIRHRYRFYSFGDAMFIQ